MNENELNNEEITQGNYHTSKECIIMITKNDAYYHNIKGISNVIMTKMSTVMTTNAIQIITDSSNGIVNSLIKVLSGKEI